MESQPQNHEIRNNPENHASDLQVFFSGGGGGGGFN